MAEGGRIYGQLMRLGVVPSNDILLDKLEVIEQERGPMGDSEKERSIAWMLFTDAAMMFSDANRLIVHECQPTTYGPFATQGRKRSQRTAGD